MQFHGSVYQLEELPRVIRGEATAVVTGAFDFMHPGSLALLREVRARARSLGVLVWDDATAELSLGYRPVNEAPARARYVTYFRAVEWSAVITIEQLESALSLVRPALAGVWESDSLRAKIEAAALRASVPVYQVATERPRSSGSYPELFRRALS